MILLQELISTDSPINSKLRIHISSKPIDKLYSRDVMQGNEPVTKPNGLWYGFGREWLDLLMHDLERDISKHYIYFVKITNSSKILRIHNKEGMISFVEKYYWKPLIDWRRVANDYSGIEINPWQGKLYREMSNMSWYGTWDVASGCVWDTSCIELKLIYPKK